MDSSIPRSRGLIVPVDTVGKVPCGQGVLFERLSGQIVARGGRTTSIEVGVVSMANFDAQEDNLPERFNTYVAQCKEEIKGTDSVDVMLICGSGSFLQTRSAIIGVSEQFSGKIFPLVQFSGEECTTDGWDAVSQIVALQALNVHGIVIDCEDPWVLESVFAEMAPHIRVPMGVWVHDVNQVPQSVLPYITYIMCKEHKSHEQILAYATLTGFFDDEPLPYTQHDTLVAVTNGRVAFIEPYVDISDGLVCDETFSEQVLDYEDDQFAVTKVEIPDQNSLDIFEMEQYLLREPVCLHSEDTDILCRAVRMFCGVALYDGTGDISGKVLNELTQRYGLIVL